MKLDRRKFIINSSIASLALAASPFAAQKLSAATIQMSKNLTVLFQGDSITDAGRAKDKEDAN